MRRSHRYCLPRAVSRRLTAPCLTLFAVTAAVAGATRAQEPPAPTAPPGSVAAAAQADATPQLVISVNGHPINFIGQAPIEQSGHLLVPLRGVLEQLGASLAYDRPTQTVFAVRDADRISLTIGQKTAKVNGKYVPLDAPAQEVNGSTLVPLRFMAEAFGAKVSYDLATNTVSIITPETTPPKPAPTPTPEAAVPVPAPTPVSPSVTVTTPAPTPPVAPTAPTTVVGTVVGVYADVAPARIVVRGGGAGATGAGDTADQSLPLQQGVALTAEHSSGTPVPIPLGRVEIGDRVAVLRAVDGTAQAVNILLPATPSVRPRTPAVANDLIFKGTFLRWDVTDDHRYRLKMQDGRTIDVAHEIPILFAGQMIRMAAVRAGDYVMIDIDPRTHSAIRMVVTYRP